VRFQIGQICIAQLAGCVLSHRLEYRDDIHRLIAPDARHDRAAVDKHCRAIQPRERHHTARHVLVASANCHDAVEALAPDYGLD
jgi:hypothetical protein